MCFRKGGGETGGERRKNAKSATPTRALFFLCAISLGLRSLFLSTPFTIRDLLLLTSDSLYFHLLT